MPGPAFFSVAGVSGVTPSGFVQTFVGQWNLPAGQWPENRKIWSTGGLIEFDETGVCTPTPGQPAGNFTVGATTAYDSGGAFIRLYNDTVNLYLVMNDHANVLVPGAAPGSEVARVGSNARSSLLFQMSF